MSNKVAVYGTLKSDGRADGMMCTSTFIGYGTTKHPYNMTDVGFPKIKPHPDGDVVSVEVYDSPDWEQLDSYEGVPYLYTRNVIDIIMENGDVEAAYIYEANELTGSEVVAKNGVLTWT